MNRKMDKSEVSIALIKIHQKMRYGKFSVSQFQTQDENEIKCIEENEIEKISSYFIPVGNGYISSRKRQSEMMIKCDKKQLECFLITLKSDLKSASKRNTFSLHSLAKTVFENKSFPVKMLEISKEVSYTIPCVNTGLSKMAEDLTLIGLNTMQINLENLSFRGVAVLHLVNNGIKILPEEIGELVLRELNLTGNALGEIGNWKFLSNKMIQSTLQILNLSNNRLEMFPYNIVRLDNLYSLMVNCNSIKKLPFGIRRLKKLRLLFVQHNRLECLPNIISCLKLLVLDVRDNPFKYMRIIYDECNKSLPTLGELAATIIDAKKIPVRSGEVPQTLINKFLESPICGCGLMDFTPHCYGRIECLSLYNVHYLIGRRTIFLEHVVCAKCLRFSRRLRLSYNQIN